MLIAGLGFPIPFWLLHRKYPKLGFNYVFTPVLVGKDSCAMYHFFLPLTSSSSAELGVFSAGINSSLFTMFLLTIFSQYYIRRYIWKIFTRRPLIMQKLFSDITLHGFVNTSTHGYCFYMTTHWLEAYTAFFWAPRLMEEPRFASSLLSCSLRLNYSHR